jgi:hypothetical protein
MRMFLISSLLSFVFSSFAFAGTDNTTNTTTISRVNQKNQDIINNVMNYQISPDIVKKFQHETRETSEKATLIEMELKRFLLMAALVPGKRVAMLSRDVDELWHTFLLFTQEYADFCMNTFGKIIHHRPCSQEEIENRPADYYTREYAYFAEQYELLFAMKPNDAIWESPEKKNNIEFDEIDYIIYCP